LVTGGCAKISRVAFFARCFPHFPWSHGIVVLVVVVVVVVVVVPHTGCVSGRATIPSAPISRRLQQTE